MGDLADEGRLPGPEHEPASCGASQRGLVPSRRDGTTVYYRLADPRVLEAYRLIQALAR